MNNFDALLKRSFAEVDEPVDNGFSALVTGAVTRREASRKVSAAIRGVFWAVASAAVAYGGYALAMSLGLDSLITVAADQVGEARGVLNQAPSTGEFTQNITQTVGAGMTQILLVIAALAGGAVAYRTTQD